MRRDAQRLADIVAGARAIEAHIERGELSDDLIFDAVRIRLVELGEAVKAIDASLLALESSVPWQDVAGVRDRLAHRDFDTDHRVVAATIERDLPPLVAAVERLQAALSREPEK